MISRTQVFSNSSLPLTMAFADKHKRDIKPILTEGSVSLPYHDRVLFLLMPFMERDIVRFHSGMGPGLNKVLGSQAIEHIDQELLTNLADKIKVTLDSHLDESLIKVITQNTSSSVELVNFFNKFKGDLPHKTVRNLIEDEHAESKYIKLTNMEVKVVQDIEDIVTDYLRRKVNPNGVKKYDSSDLKISLFQIVTQSPKSTIKIITFFAHIRDILPHRTVDDFIKDEDRQLKYLTTCEYWEKNVFKELICITNEYIEKVQPSTIDSLKRWPDEENAGCFLQKTKEVDNQDISLYQAVIRSPLSQKWTQSVGQ